MKIYALARLGLAFSFVGLGACEVEDEPSLVTLDEIEAAVSAELCERVFTCQCNAGRYYGDVRDCEEDAARIAEQLQQLSIEYTGASVTYDPACAGQMIDQIVDLGCGSDLPDPPSCERPCRYFVGSRSKGSSCENLGDGINACAQGLVCSGGRCLDPCGGPDEPCSGSSTCAPGLLCSPVSDTCQPPPAEGQPCLNNRCGDDSYCDFSESAGVCKLLPVAGELCLDGSTCADGLFCADVDPADPMTERQCFGPQALQAPCQGHAQCQSGYCPAGFCQARPGNGEACPAEVCAEGLDCIGEVCQPADAALCWASVPYI